MVRTSGDMTAVVWKDNHDMHMLTDIYDTPAEGNFCDESGNALMPATVEKYK
jgi:hypothetical protein